MATTTHIPIPNVSPNANANPTPPQEYGFVMETVQGIPFRMLCESLKDTLVDATLCFSSAGVNLSSLDNTKSVIIHLAIPASRIERYICHGNYALGINTQILFRMVKNITASDSIKLSYSEATPTVLKMEINNIDRHNKLVYHMKLLSLRPTECQLTKTDLKEYNIIVQMPSQTFQKSCKEIQNAGAHAVELLAGTDRLVLRCIHAMVELELEIYEKQGSVSVTTNYSAADRGNGTTTAPIVTPTPNSDTTTPAVPFFRRTQTTSPLMSFGEYPVKQLHAFAKCCHSSPIIDVYLKQGYPLVLQYNAANLGSIRYYIAYIIDGETGERRG
jgi:hypothetical protein